MQTTLPDTQLKSTIAESLQELIEKDDELINNHASEWAIVHRFAVYLEKRLPKYNVDCEYNLHINNPKRLDGNLIRPDVLVHKRGEDSANLIAIEFRKKKRGRDALDQRLQNFKQQFNYRYVEYILIPNSISKADGFTRKEITK